MKIKNLHTQDLEISDLTIPSGESVCFAGSNRSGILSLFNILARKINPENVEMLDLPQAAEEVSFATQQEIYETELDNDETDFMNRQDTGTPARQFLFFPEKHMGLIAAFKMDQLLDKGYRELSTGQTRKLVLLSKITKGVKTLLLLSPYDGLDTASRKELNLSFKLMQDKGVQVLLFVHNTTDIPAWCRHLVFIDSGNLIYSGAKSDVDKQTLQQLENMTPDFKGQLSDMNKYVDTSVIRKTPLIELNNGTAAYSGKTVFSNLSLKIFKGDHTLISGPNGSGKSTLLHLFTGEHPACYQNDLKVFGTQRGSGESIWDIKKQMGIISSDLHRNYRVPGSLLACVLSGLYDSIGLYRKVSFEEKQVAQKWLDRIGLSEKSGSPFRNLSFADQRLALIARALIKSPQILILDEPTQGLDQANRRAILDFIEMLAEEQYTTVLYVSHREDEFRNFFTQQIRMDQYTG